MRRKFVMDDKKIENSSGRAEGIRGWRRGYWSLFVTQFQGAFSDNAYKFLVMFLFLDEKSDQEKQQYLLVAGAVFALPFIVFSMVAGLLSNRYSKRRLVISTKVAEVIEPLAGILRSPQYPCRQGFLLRFLVGFRFRVGV